MHDSKDLGKAGLHQLPGCILAQGDANTSGQGSNLRHTEIAKGESEMAREPMFEVGAVATLEGQFVVVENRAAHLKTVRREA